MSREVRRVPLDFAWPLNEVWEGYLIPDDLMLPSCTDCRYGKDHSSGYSPAANAVASTFYPHMIGPGQHGDMLAWCDKIGQAEVDNLLAKGRLRTLVKREPTEDNPRDREWQALPRTADEVNAAQRAKGMGSHDAINKSFLVEFRCERLGIPLYCPTCEGATEVATDEQRAAHEAWQPADPPAGDGWQLWETVSEGSPISPVFATREALIGWLATEYMPVTGVRLTVEQVTAFVAAGHSVGSFAWGGGQMLSGEAAVSGLPGGA